MRALSSLLCIAAAAGVTLADGPAMPTGVFTKDAVLYGEVNVAGLGPQKVREAVRAVVDTERLEAMDIGFDAQAELEPMLARLGQLQMFTSMLESNGASTVNFVMQMPEGAEKPDVFVLMPAASEQAAQQLSGFAGMMGGQSGMVPATTTAGEGDGASHWVILHDPSTSYEGEWSQARQQQLDAAMDSMGERAVRIALAPNDAIRAQAMKDTPEDAPAAARAAMESMMKAQWLGMWMDTGAKPQLGVGASMASEDDARAVAAAYAEAMRQMMSSARAADAEAGDAEGYNGPMPSEAATALSEACGLEHSGSRLKIVIDDAELRELTVMAVHAAKTMGDGFADSMRRSLEGFGDN